MAELRQNTWTLDQWYDQSVAGNVNYMWGGEFYSWGSNSSGCLGIGAPGNQQRSSPTQIGTATSWAGKVVSISNAAMAIKS